MVNVDHRNVAELDWCYVASSGKICAANVSELLVSTNIELHLGICQKFCLTYSGHVNIPREAESKITHHNVK